ncbi:hypothetical protein Zmor_010341 [Zophobas morio]|uniref:Uncharacterized protein n=1 Tax=Zophobas morio TaxID=2755281 RepID=A0AA38MJW6_9CUCU|nr:hypothetical protein Zmor_010341 [Zophobas morio]
MDYTCPFRYLPSHLAGCLSEQCQLITELATWQDDVTAAMFAQVLVSRPPSGCVPRGVRCPRVHLRKAHEIKALPPAGPLIDYRINLRYTNTKHDAEHQ